MNIFFKIKIRIKTLKNLQDTRKGSKNVSDKLISHRRLYTLRQEPRTVPAPVTLCESAYPSGLLVDLCQPARLEGQVDRDGLRLSLNPQVQWKYINNQKKQLMKCSLFHKRLR